MKFLIAFALFVSVAHAQQMSRDDFARLSDEEKVTFLENHATERSATARDQSSAIFKKLLNEAVGVSDVWYDTILEGPYALTGDAGVESSTVFTYNKLVFAYHFNVSAAAIFTEGEGCEFNEETEQWSEECMDSTGTISQGILYDFSGREIDDGSYPEFND